MQENQDNQVTESNDTNAEAPASTLRDDLMAAFSSEEGEVVDEVAEDEEQEHTEEEVESTQETEENPEDDLPVFEAPNNWNKEEKQFFNQLPEELELEDGTVVPIKEILTKYDKSRQADYTRKTREVAELRNEFSPIKDLIDPYKGNFERLGIKPADYMQQLIDLDISLHQDPAGTIKQAMDKFKLTPEQLGLTADAESSEDDEYLSDEERKIIKLEKKLQALEGKQNANEQTFAQKESQAKVNKVLKEFEQAVDESGELLYPHYLDRDVQEEMSILVNRGKTLEEAYKASPAARTLELGNSNQVSKADKATETRKEVAKAKRASLRVKTKKSSTYSDLPSMKDELKAKYFASS